MILRYFFDWSGHESKSIPTAIPNPGNKQNKPLSSNNVRNEIECNPDVFFRTRLRETHFATVRRAASLVGADPDNLVLCANVTSALNDVLKSIRLKPEDQGRPSVLS